ncbi:hypothetical protein GWR56_07990 [Mucilaginibacter sp. 14171R-50]|uniref:DUF4175 family protein n=1 Tax=Mucilaginibacter sp. 14171R-50 TaxID=2703789 RepID=UPI00138BC3B3|nr:DUF4175 family protein [Mucilaginibacter sp. 14171R-50]QHS55481.1 hypothetical protein GWR56_07990 [Mucilaginibacter sp. 14171R-50]
MAEHGGIHKIQSLRRRWVVYHVLEDVLLSLYAGLYVGALVYYLLSPSLLWGIITFPLVLAVMLAVNRPWHVSDEKIASFLNKEYPELQESSQLLLLPAEQLNPLQVIASSKTSAVLAGLKISHKPFARRLVVAFVSLMVATGLIWALGKIFHIERIFYGPNRAVAVCGPAPLPEVILPQISDVEVTVTPPAYTGRPKRMQDKFNLVTEQDARVEWHIKTNVAIKKGLLIFNNKEKINLISKSKHTEWYASSVLHTPGFYQVSIDGKLSELYYVQLVKDNPPVIRIKSPKQYTYIDAGEAPKINISATITDQYGVTNVSIMATVAKGRGEGVKFKEYTLTFPQGFNAQSPLYDVQKLVNLPALNMEPGDQLYFYVQAHDTHKQLSRTDVYTVSLQDTAELLSMNGMLTGVNLKPEFFRSERQIIIDAQQLLKDKDSISVERFNARSNDLGIDQKLLRLRYGKFLGEEGEDAIGTPDDEAADPADFSNAKKILKEYTDDHDNAEDAGFFEPEVKAQLKATLTEMWKAELQLRLYKPQAALPFAYKALRLLKDLQQKSRSYVAKTAYKPTPLKLEKRLSGELDKVIQPVTRQDIKPPADKQEALKKAVSVLEALKLNPVLNATGRRALQVADQQLSMQASARPGAYLPALNAMRRILSSSNANINDVNAVEVVLQKTLGALKTLPSSGQEPADMGLSKQYYKNLKQANR